MLKMIPKYSVILFGLFIPIHFYTQDLHFSRFNENPSLINPALTGVSSVVRASLVYRNQWLCITEPYKTYGLSVESKFKASNWKEIENQSMMFTKNTFNRFAGGLSCYSDKAGDGNMGITQVNLSLATFVSVSQNSQLSLGLQGSLVQRKIDFSKLVFSTQYNGAGYDPGLPNGENASTQTFMYPDIAAGLNWNYANQDNIIASNKQKKINIGVALYHMNKSKQAYLMDSHTKLYMKYILHGDFLFGITHTNIGLAPSYLLQFQGPSRELIAGTIIKYYVKEDSKYTGIIKRTSVNFGVFYRYQDAVIVSFSYDRKQQYEIGLSYDVNVSGLTKASKLNGGPEITLKFNTSNPYLYQKRTKSK